MDDTTRLTPTPPYTAVIFTSQRHVRERDGYDATAQRMGELPEQQDGYLGIESVRDAEGAGITVSYWRDHDFARAWKQVAEHLAAQARGRDEWYEHYTVRVATVDREYGS